MISFFTLPFAAALLAGLLLAEKGGREKNRLVLKAILSGLFVLVAWDQHSRVPAYGNAILLGLLFCLGGDVCLALRGEKPFRAGLAAFLAGHVFYGIGFAGLVPPSDWLRPPSLLFWGFSFFVFLWLRPHLKGLRVPVGVYILAITGMVSGAWAVFAAPSFPFGGRVTVLLGAVLFYLSDVFVARDQFVNPAYLNRLAGLPLYYLGQFFLAFSIGLL